MALYRRNNNPAAILSASLDHGHHLHAMTFDVYRLVMPPITPISLATCTSRHHLFPFLSCPQPPQPQHAVFLGPGLRRHVHAHGCSASLAGAKHRRSFVDYLAGRGMAAPPAHRIVPEGIFPTIQQSISINADAQPSFFASGVVGETRSISIYEGLILSTPRAVQHSSADGAHPRWPLLHLVQPSRLPSFLWSQRAFVRSFVRSCVCLFVRSANRTGCSK